MKVLNLGVVPEHLFRQLRYVEGFQVPAGFPSPADDYAEKSLSLDEHLVRNRAATFLMRAVGHSMEGAGIFNGDLLVVDRSVAPTSGRIVVVALNGEFTVKRFRRERGAMWLESANPEYLPIYLTADCDLHFFGTVIHAIHTLV